MANLRSPGVLITERDISEVIIPAGTSVGALVGGAHQGPTNQRKLITNDKEFVQTFGTPKTGAASEFPYYAALEFLKESGFLWFTRTTSSADTVGVSTVAADGTITSATESEKQTSTLLGTAGYEDGNTSINYETIETVTTDPLIVGAIGPGSYSKDIGITIVTSAESSTSSLDYEYGYNFVDKYPTSNKLYRINVYVKDSLDSETDAGWDGSDPLKSVRPVETFIVSNEETDKDFDGNSMYVKDVINGKSKYVYVNTNGTELTAGSTAAVTALGEGLYDILSADVEGGWDLYKSKEAVTPNILLAPYTHSPRSDAAAAIANSRKDCIAVCQVGFETVTDVTSLSVSSAKSTSYVSNYAGGEYVFDKYTRKTLVLPLAVFAGKAYAFNDNVANVWNAPAGLSRGAVNGSGPYKAFNESEIGFLYNQNINTLKAVRGSGEYIWGQKTGQKRSTALDRVNVRRLLLYIESSVEPLLQGYLFEQNTDALRSRVVANINSFLQTVFSGGGLTAFETVCDETNNTSQVIDSNQLAVDIYVQPTKTIEFINLQVTITRTGVDFSEIA